MQRNRMKNDSVRQNPAAENIKAPTSLPKNEINRSAPSKGKALPIPSTRGYVGKRIK